jgi:pyruvate kinase
MMEKVAGGVKLATFFCYLLEEVTMRRCAKIVATIGPACREEGMIRRLLKAGVNVGRLNFSHGSHDNHAEVIVRLRRIAAELGRPVSILQDLQGPKIRTGELPADGIELTANQSVTLSTRPGEPDTIPVDFDELPRSVQPGGRILLDDGNLEMRVLATDEEHVQASVVVGGVLKSHKGINLPGAVLNILALTEKDENDLAFGLSQGVDAIALSFVRSSDDIRYLRQKIEHFDSKQVNIPIIAKLERPESLDNLEAITHVSDGVMVARGDLGVEMSPQEVPIAQKRIIECANRHGKVVITATQMLDSMIHNPRPTRAEASDVANAIFDGTDAVMLSGETAVGAYPVAAVEMMNAIICQAEANMEDWGHWKGEMVTQSSFDDTFYMTQAARELAHDRNVAAIAVFTKSGRTALLLSKIRPGVPILAFTPEETTYSRLEMYWGVIPYLVPHANTIDEMLIAVEGALMASQTLQPGQQVVLICGFPVNEVRPTNLALLHTIGEH